MVVSNEVLDYAVETLERKYEKVKRQLWHALSIQQRTEIKQSKDIADLQRRIEALEGYHQTC